MWCEKKLFRGGGIWIAVLKKLIIFNTIQDMLVEVASTTCADIIEEYSLEEKNTNKNTNKWSS